MYSPGEGRYVEVGHLATYGDYLSRRMMLKAVADEANLARGSGHLADLRIVSGCLLDVTRAVGCLVENSQREDGSYVL